MNRPVPNETDAPPSLRRLSRPWWFPFFLGRIPIGLERHHVALVGMVGLAALFENYDMSMLSAAMKQIRTDFGLSQADATSFFAWIRLGAFPAFLVLPLADRLGRRRVFLAAIVGMSLGTLVSAFAQTAIQFVVAQTVTRTFIVASIACAVVILAEELPAKHRGWGIGLLGALGSLGFGLGALTYAFVEVLPFGWRSLYAVGGVPLLLLPVFIKGVPETARFEAANRARENAVDGEGPTPWIAPLLELARDYPARMFAVTTMALLFALASAPAFGLVSDFVQSTHGWEPSRFSAMTLVGGAVGIIGNPAMGFAADRFGRRPVAAVAFGFFPLLAYAIYYGPAWLLPVFWMPFIFFLTGANVLLRTISTELFPTTSRNTALGWETLMETLGAAFGFLLVGWLTLSGESIAPAAFLVSLLSLVAVGVVLFLPETAGRELETLTEASPASAAAAEDEMDCGQRVPAEAGAAEDPTR